MPYKDPQKQKERNRRYYLAHREEAIRKAIEYSKTYHKTPFGRFLKQRQKAVHKRGIEWKLSFEEWWKIWQDSGHWDERGQTGYHMCRKGDNGPYSVDNVYIAPVQVNSLDQILNNKGPYQTRKYDDNISSA